MSLISIEFAVGFLLFLPLYWLFRRSPRLQNLLLTVVSLGVLWHFISGEAVGVLVGFTTWVYLVSRGLARSSRRASRTAWLWAGVLGAIGHLAVWKYAEFFRPVIEQALATRGLPHSAFESTWLLPMGVSYYTFQGISYLVGQYRGQIPSPGRLSPVDLLHHFGLFLTLSSGPIHRTVDAKQLTDVHGYPCNALDQIQTRQPRSIQAPTLAMALILAGLCKKWWLAGWLAQTAVDPVFSNPSLYQSFDVLVAIYGYTLQLFFDFSGYSDLVIGLGMLLGLRLPVNFRAPLLAHNIREFWNRWHISLSTWIRDYIYLPLGGSRRGMLLTQINLLIAMGLSGVWHGFGWNFLLWGLVHGVGLVLLNLVDRLVSTVLPPPLRGRDRLAATGWPGRVIGVFVTVQFVCLAFVLFRTRTLDEARTVFDALANNFHDIPAQTHSVPLLLTMLLLWALYPLLRRAPKAFARCVDWLPTPFRPAPLLAAFALIVLLAPPGIPGFIYANF
ncbi:MBOAT family O-acyltransferase [Stenotrophomonas rhizophila]